MKNYLIRRLLMVIPILFGVTFITFFIIYLAPGSPLDLMVGPDTTPEARDAMARSLGLDAPVYRQYLAWLGNVVRGNLGYSFSSFRPVTQVIGERIPATFMLMGSALLIGILIAIPLGVLSALKQHSVFDYTATVLAFFGVSVPNFFLGLGLIFVFSIKLKLFPSSGMFTLGGDKSALDIMHHLVLPCTILAAGIAGRFIRYIRSAMLDILQQDYLRTAAAKGVPFVTRIGVHAFRNALLPLITLVGLEIPSLLGGAVISEQIFSWPGIGRLTIDSILVRDYPVLMGLNVMTAGMVILSSLITDLLYAAADPRIKYH
ncbi:MAG: ABC transporter permease [Spirochaetaceae bacterium]|jgi:peptide/nickel transport system permease protein|nr:ABC transporter permease [Spirochaetaceae bacterium]